MKRKHKRLTFVMVALVLLGIAAGLILNAFEDNIVFFYSPTEIKAKQLKPDQRLRLGGLVEDGSMDKQGGGITVFRVTDTANSISVSYKGILPDLFREGQGVIAEGHLKDGVFVAAEVLAKHDENYMPPEVADALKKSGQWKESDEAKENTQ
jgi:cytochrome c-type biogenesis protein CcmE